ncbi:similar to An03g00260 [Aspergillus luchuensis]|uniref:Similar to An03g00260 n=1 Tax=Aspergillus kawachii TaxID=1069201 RepID=A0A146FBJ1_ASPKA|nr:similar to An03g00260 [Aspergillus luchuensis]
MEDPNAHWPDIDIDPGFTTVPGDHSLGRDTYSRPNASEITYTAHELEDLHALTYPGWRTLFRLKFLSMAQVPRSVE